jgi:hypothetical protein
LKWTDFGARKKREESVCATERAIVKAGERERESKDPWAREEKKEEKNARKNSIS